MDSSKELSEVVARIGDPNTMMRFFAEIFTPAERRAFALRWRLMQMLHARVPQRTIAAELGISLCKITRGSRVLKNRKSVTRAVLDRASKASKP